LTLPDSASIFLFVPEIARTGQRQSSARRNLELIALRVNAGLSRDDLATRAGIGRETVRLAEAGFVPTPRVQFAIARAFDRLPLDIWPIERQKATRRQKGIR
jgi:DNA-binding XRE family transcriptional regulator